MSTQDEIIKKFRVKVMRQMPDARITIAGEKFIVTSNPDHDGTEIDGKPVDYAVVPAHVADHLKAHAKNYTYSEPFLPTAEDVKKK